MRNCFLLLVLFLILNKPGQVHAKCHVGINSFGEPYLKFRQMFFAATIIWDCGEVTDLLNNHEIKKTRSNGINANCSGLVNKMLDNFDCHDTYTGAPVCFKSELEEILNSFEGQKYLKDLNAAFSDFYSSQKEGRFKVWNWTIEYFKGDQEKAVKYLAVLFQDYAHDISTYIDTSADSSVKEDLKEAQANFHKRSYKFDLLPPGVEGEHQKAYHLYMTAHVAYQMKKDFPNNNIARFLPVVLNNRYEMLSLYNANGSLETLPKSIDKFTDNSKNDMYLAIQGYRVFVNKSKPETFKEFSVKTNSDFKKYMRSLIEEPNK